MEADPTSLLQYEMLTDVALGSHSAASESIGQGPLVTDRRSLRPSAYPVHDWQQRDEC